MVQTCRELILNQEVAHGMRVSLTARPLAIVLFAIVLLSARMRTDNVIFAQVTFLDDFVTTFRQLHTDVARTGLTFNGFAALLHAVVTTPRKSKFVRGLTIFVRMRWAAFVWARMFPTAHLVRTRMIANESCWIDVALLCRRVFAHFMDERHFGLACQFG